MVKRLWTPSFAFFSAGWVIVMLMAFYWTIEVRKWKAWTFPVPDFRNELDLRLLDRPDRTERLAQSRAGELYGQLPFLGDLVLFRSRCW